MNNSQWELTEFCFKAIRQTRTTLHPVAVVWNPWIESLDLACCPPPGATEIHYYSLQDKNFIEEKYIIIILDHTRGEILLEDLVKEVLFYLENQPK